MALPQAAEARVFYQSATQRWIDAEILLREGRTTGATYLAGYSVECMLKALILSVTPARDRESVLTSFRGVKGHNYHWLKARYFEGGGPQVPRFVSDSFLLVNTWTTDLRYETETLNPIDAAGFLTATKVIFDWADERL